MLLGRCYAVCGTDIAYAATRPAVAAASFSRPWPLSCHVLAHYPPKAKIRNRISVQFVPGMRFLVSVARSPHQ
eukprot:1492308-Rhodomonas_salina.1